MIVKRSEASLQPQPGENLAKPVSGGRSTAVPATPVVAGFLTGQLNWFDVAGDSTLQRAGCLIVIRCPHCGDQHQHGWPEIGWCRPSHRLSHCLKIDSNGYYIMPVLPGEPGFSEHVHDPLVPLFRRKPSRRPPR